MRQSPKKHSKNLYNSGFYKIFAGLFMPIYAYRCEACGFTKDVLQKMSDPQLTECPSCAKSTFKKQLTAAGFQLKGSGWYATDFRGGSGDKTPPEAPPEGKTSTPTAAPAAPDTGGATSTPAASTTDSAGKQPAAKTDA
jgi:putative FmdB family regulatory protein